MKKFVSLALLLVVFAGCNKEKRYENDLNGTWTIYKYLLNNIDQTNQYLAQHQNYTITFTNSGQFTESYSFDSVPTVKHGTYHFINYYQGIALVDTLYIPIDSTVYDSLYERDYTLFDLTKASVQLRDSADDFYLQKEP